MNAKDRQRLQDNHLALVTTLDFLRTHILDHLFSDGILSAGDIEEIEKKPTASGRANLFLLNILPKKGPKAFEKFVRALVKEGQSDAAALLDPELTKKCVADAPVLHGTRSSVLKDNHIDLISNLDFDNTLLGDTLLQKKLLNETKLELIQSQSVNWRKARYFLLNILPRSGPTALDRFFEALQETEGQEYIFEKLQVYLLAPDNPDSGRIQQESISENDIIQLLDNPLFKACQPITSVSKEEAAVLLQQGAYPMRNKVRGRAVIINNRCFLSSNTEQRNGSEHDLRELDDLFTRLNFQVVSYTDVFAEEIVDFIRIETEDIDHSNYDAFVLFIMSHGMNGHVLGANDKSVKVDDIVSKVGSCQTLHNKPKLIFIQACRPDDKESLNLVDDVCFKAETYAKPPAIKHESQTGNEQVKLVSQKAKLGSDAVGSLPQSIIANYKDVIIANSTIPGFLSWRRKDSGSFFVRYFVYVCSTRAHKEDLASMLNTVNGLLTQRPKGVQFEQIGESVFRGISKKVYFFPDYYA